MRAAHNSKQIKVVKSAGPKAASLPEPLRPLPEDGAEKPARVARGKLRGFARVPTHVVGFVDERRAYPRAALSLPLRLLRVAGQREPVPISLVTRNISSSGVYFLAPKNMEPGTAIELEIGLVERPLGRGGVRMRTVARVVRAEAATEPGWHAVAAQFDDIAFQRDEALPPRFMK